MSGETLDRMQEEIAGLRAKVTALTAQREAEREAWGAVIAFLEEYCSNEGRQLASGKRALRAVRGALGPDDNSPREFD